MNLRESRSRMERLAEEMRGKVYTPAVAWTMAANERLDRAEASIRAVYAAVLADPATLLAGAPPNDGTTYRAEVLNAARELVASGIDVGAVERMVVEGGYGPGMLQAVGTAHRLRRETLTFGKFPLRLPTAQRGGA